MNASVFFNPGSGPVDNATLENAVENISQLIVDAGFDIGQVVIVHFPQKDKAGRFHFELHLGKYFCEVAMPGIELEKVRYIDGAGQNPFEFPRLYIDGSSWIWPVAATFVKSDLLGIVDE